MIIVYNVNTDLCFWDQLDVVVILCILNFNEWNSFENRKLRAQNGTDIPGQSQIFHTAFEDD